MFSEEQEARIALLQLYTSQMQSLKTSVLATFVALLTLFEVWFRMGFRNTIVNGLLSTLIGITVAFDFHSFVRLLWYGRLWRCTLTTQSRRNPAVDKPLIGQLSEDISYEAKFGQRREGYLEKALLFFEEFGWPTRKQDEKGRDRIFERLVACVFIALVVFVIIFFFAVPIFVDP